MPESFENQPEEEKEEKLEDMDFEEKVEEVLHTLNALGIATIGETHPGGYEEKYFKDVQSNITPEEWNELKTAGKKINPAWWFEFSHNGSSLAAIIEQRKRTGKIHPEYKEYAGHMEKLFKECEWWPELNSAHKLLSPFFPKERIDRADY